jgi:hypothetical protein
MILMAANTEAQQVAGLSIDKFLTRCRLAKEGTEDFEVKLKDVDYMSNGTLRVDRKLFGFTPWSMQQFCAKMHVPVDFLRRSPPAGYASQKAIVGHWKEQVEDKRVLIRVKKHPQKDASTGEVGRIRAVLSDRYSVFDNMDLLELFEPLLKKHELNLKATNLSDNEMHLRVVNPELFSIGNNPRTGEPDLHQYGFHLLNSEVGARNIQGDMFFLRQVCKNGLVVPAGQEHLFYVSHGRKLAAGEIKNQLHAGIERLVIEQESVREQFTAAAVETVSVAQGAAQIRQLMREGGAPKETVEKAIETFENTQDLTRFGVVQAITANVRTMGMSRRFDVESAAGSYMVAA